MVGDAEGLAVRIVVGAEVPLANVGFWLGDDVSTLLGKVVGDEVGRDAAGEDVPHSFATFISTSAQFQNWKGAANEVR